MNTETFIKKSKAKYPGLFTYEKTVYKNCNTPVIITSIEYGDFTVTPHYHLKPSTKTGGCMFLSKDINRNLDKNSRIDWLIKKSKNLYPNQFLYDKIDRDNFKDNSSIITLVCKDHGEFKTRFADHLRKNRGSGCPYCGSFIAGKISLKEKEKIFIKKSNFRFPNHYDYSKLNFSGLCDENELFLTCKIHNYSFKISPPDHFRSRVGGCIYCTKEKLETERLLKREEKYKKHLKNAIKVHNNFYDYSKIDTTIPLNLKNTIICPIHGEFFQGISYHSRGEGCPYCSSELKESKAAQLLKKDINKNKIPEFIFENENYLKNKPYDLYIKDLNLIIEVQGEQHRKCCWGMSEEDLKKRKEIDRNKKELALKNGFYYLEIIYLDNLKKIKMIINDINSSTTIESFEEKIKNYSSKLVEYTKPLLVETKSTKKCEDIV